MIGRAKTAAVLVLMLAPTAAVSDKGVSMARFTDAKAEISKFPERLGAYTACHELVGIIREGGYRSDSAAVIKTLFQGATAPDKVRRGFLEALEKDGFSFEQMMMLDELLAASEAKSHDETRLAIETTDEKNVLKICSLARGQIKG